MFNPLTPLTVSMQMNPLGPLEKAFFQRYKVGGVCLFRGSLTTLGDITALLETLNDLLGPDTLISIDQEGGSVVRIPQLPHSPGGRVLGLADDAERTYRIARGQAAGLKALGINVNFAPLLDVNSNPLNPVIGERAFAADLERVIRHGLAFLRGHRDAGVLAVSKHFPGHGDTGTDSHLALPILHKTLKELSTLELAPFRAASEQGLLEAMMTAHILFPELDPLEPVTLSQKALEQLTARLTTPVPSSAFGTADRMLGMNGVTGWNGLMYSDGLNMAAILDRYPQGESARRCIEAGCDQALMFTPDLPDQIPFIEAYLKNPPTSKSLERATQKHAAAVKKYPFTRPDRSALEQVLSDRSLRDDIAWVASAALTVRGDLPRLTRETRVLAVSPQRTSGGAASNSLPLAVEVRPLLLEAFSSLTVLEYGGADFSLEELSSVAHKAEVIVFITAQRLKLEGELEVAQALEGHPKVVHLNLWNPEVSAELPFPGIQTSSYHPVSVRAGIERLLEG